jgi:hypothetical protein
LKNIEGRQDEKREERSINEEERKEAKRIEQIESNVRAIEDGGRPKEIEEGRRQSRSDEGEDR